MYGEDYFELRDSTTKLWPYNTTTLLFKIAFIYCANQTNDLQEKLRDAEHNEKLLSIYQRNQDFYETAGHLVISISVKPEKCEVEVQIERVSDELLTLTGRKSKMEAISCLVENGLFDKTKKRCRDIQIGGEIGKILFDFDHKILDNGKIVNTLVTGYSFGDGLILLSFSPAK